MKFSKILISIFISASAFATANIASAQSYSAQLSQCIVQNTSTQDRQALVQWMAIGMLAHPDLKGFTTITPQQTQVFDQNAATILNRILTRDCRAEFANTVKYEGLIAMQQSFQTLGAVAAEELMTNPAVAERFTAIEQYLDPKAFEGLF